MLGFAYHHSAFAYCWLALFGTWHPQSIFVNCLNNHLNSICNKSSDNVKWRNIFHRIWPLLCARAFSFIQITWKYENEFGIDGRDNGASSVALKTHTHISDRSFANRFRVREMSRKTDKIEQNIAYEFKSHSIMLYIIKFHAVNILSLSVSTDIPPTKFPSRSILSVRSSLPKPPIGYSMPMVLSWRLIHTTYHQVHYQVYVTRKHHTTAHNPKWNIVYWLSIHTPRVDDNDGENLILFVK